MDANQVNELERYALLDDTNEDRTEAILLMCSLWKSQEHLSDFFTAYLVSDMIVLLEMFKENTVITEEPVITKDLVFALTWK